MICSAAVRMLATARENAGWATVLPVTRGIRARIVSVLDFTTAGSAPTARSRPGAVEPWVASSAASRCAGSTEELPSRGRGGGGRGDDLAALGGQVLEIHGWWCLSLRPLCCLLVWCEHVTQAGQSLRSCLIMMQRTKVECIPLNFDRDRAGICPHRHRQRAAPRRRIGAARHADHQWRLWPNQPTTPGVALWAAERYNQLVGHQNLGPLSTEYGFLPAAGIQCRAAGVPRRVG